MSNWKNLEKFVKDILWYDDPKLTPASGATKSEEDVVGLQSVCQCKFTEDKNISILSKDLKRLLNASTLLHKFPFFFTESQAGRIVSLPITKDTDLHIECALRICIVLHALDELDLLVKGMKSIRDLKKAESEYDRVKTIFNSIKALVNDRLADINRKIDSKYVDLTTYNLFEGMPDGTEQREETTSHQDDGEVSKDT